MKQHEAQLLKAENDIKSSRKLTFTEEPVLDIAIYHTQQCAEKALKGYLAYKGSPIHKTHNLSVLLDYCSEFDEEFGQLFVEAEKLTPLNTAFRYPEIVLTPDQEDVEDAIQSAEKILDFVKAKIE